MPDALGYGWKRFRANPIPWIALTLVGFVAYLAVTVVINVGNVNSLLSLLLIFLVVSVVVWLLQAAMIRGALYETDGTPPDFQAFFGFVNAGNVLLTALLVFVAAWVGAILCVFPALIIGFLCMFALHFVIDRDMGPVAAIKSSVQLVVTNVGTTLLLAVTVALLTFVSTLLCGLPLLVVGPVTAIALTYAYRVLVGGLVTPERRSPPALDPLDRPALAAVAGAQPQHQDTRGDDADHIDRELADGLARLVPLPQRGRHRGESGGRDGGDGNEHADQRRGFRRHQRQHARRARQQRDHQGERPDLVDEVDVVQIIDALQRDPAQPLPQQRHHHRDPHRHREADQQRQRRPPREPEVPAHQRHRDRGQRTELRTHHHRADHRHRRVGRHADHRQQAGDGHETEEGRAEGGFLVGLRDQFLPHHRVRRVAGRRRHGPLGGIGQRGVDRVEHDAAGLLDAQRRQRRQHVVGGLARDVGLHDISGGCHRRAALHGDERGAGLDAQRLQHGVGSVGRADHPDVQHRIPLW